MDAAITTDEMMAAVRKLNPAFDEVMCIDNDHWKEVDLRARADPKLRVLPEGWQSFFANSARDLDVLSGKQAVFLAHLLRHPEAFRYWLRATPI